MSLFIFGSLLDRCFVLRKIQNGYGNGRWNLSDAGEEGYEATCNKLKEIKE